ncbi:hypothetical protein [uncultured Paraglaciecola sp.]|uniref:hypothetical protein n=1 Tax=uncultured Paraglaciecola sp. TaxID=1765024 RepID=UPI002639DA32|nr:hypothetical protein [uncultured Paraglaciecola sp.]
MKRKCVDQDCGKKFVVSKDLRKEMKQAAIVAGDENLCPDCFRDVMQIAYDQSYFGSIHEWGALDT